MSATDMSAMAGFAVALLATVLAVVGCSTSASGRGDARPPPPAKVMCPELAWDAFPSETDLARDGQGLLRDAQRISYQLRVFDRDDGSLVFERRGLEDARHRPIVWLDPRRRYVWTFRPVFWLDGERRVGDWVGRSAPDRGLRDTARTDRVPVPLSLFRSVELQPEPARASGPAVAPRGVPARRPRS